MTRWNHPFKLTPLAALLLASSAFATNGYFLTPATVQRLSRANIGMCYVDERVLQANAVCADFVPLQGLDFSHIDLTFGLYFRRRRLLSTGARQFIDICNSFSFESPPARNPAR